MKKAYDDFRAIIRAFRQERALKHEKKYNNEHDSEQDNADLCALHNEIQRALGNNDNNLLNRYTDKVIELYNTNIDYFYNCGFNDCRELYSKLYSIVIDNLFDGGNDEDDEFTDLVSGVMGDDAQKILFGSDTKEDE